MVPVACDVSFYQSLDSYFSKIKGILLMILKKKSTQKTKRHSLESLFFLFRVPYFTSINIFHDDYINDCFFNNYIDNISMTR
jgi:hypothetical protein